MPLLLYLRRLYADINACTAIIECAIVLMGDILVLIISPIISGFKGAVVAKLLGYNVRGLA